MGQAKAGKGLDGREGLNPPQNQHQKESFCLQQPEEQLR